MNEHPAMMMALALASNSTLGQGHTVRHAPDPNEWEFAYRESKKQAWYRAKTTGKMRLFRVSVEEVRRCSQEQQPPS